MKTIWNNIWSILLGINTAVLTIGIALATQTGDWIIFILPVIMAPICYLAIKHNK